MTGVEHWFWIENEDVIPYYEDRNEGSKINMFPENDLFTTTINALATINITKTVFSFYQQYLGKNLSGENLNHFQTAGDYQKQAIVSLKQSEDPLGHLTYMNLSLMEFGLISN